MRTIVVLGLFALLAYLWLRERRQRRVWQTGYWDQNTYYMRRVQQQRDRARPPARFG